MIQGLDDPYAPVEFFEVDGWLAAGFRNTHGRTRVAPSVVQAANTEIILSIGDSNSTNGLGGAGYVAASYADIYMLNIYDGGIYNAHLTTAAAGTVDPVLGCGGATAHSWLTRLADKRIARAGVDRVCLAAMALGGTDIDSYASGASSTPRDNYNLKNRLPVMIRRLQDVSLTPSYVVIQNGVSVHSRSVGGSPSIADPQAYWTACFGYVKAVIRAAFPTCPIFVGNPYTYVPNLSPTTSTAVAAAQAAVTDNDANGQNVWDGAASDDLTGSNRTTPESEESIAIHFSATGGETLATRWDTAIALHPNLP
jgi:hypothetical protein